MGVLGLQGDFREHIETLAHLGVEAIAVRRPVQLDGVDALVIPGGESTTITKMLDFAELFEPVAERAANGSLGIFGTCAGMIISSKTIVDGRPDQKSLGIFDATVRRNGLGPQKFSFESAIDVEGLTEPFPMVFIRGPVVENYGESVEVLGRWGDSPVLCAQGRHVFATFHPELTGDTRIHQLFIDRQK